MAWRARPAAPRGPHSSARWCSRSSPASRGTRYCKRRAKPTLPRYCGHFIERFSSPHASPPYDMAYSLYGVDDDMDGRPDRYLIIEQSDTLASSQNDAELENPYGG